MAIVIEIIGWQCRLWVKITLGSVRKFCGKNCLKLIKNLFFFVPLLFCHLSSSEICLSLGSRPLDQEVF